jgi:hypothetical protein
MAKLSISRLEYEAILRVNRESLAPMQPDGTRGPAPNLGSFTSTQDMRQVTAGMRLNLQMKKTALTSFNINTQRCFGCSGHDEQVIWRKKGASTPLQREVLVLTDQSYPAVLPTGGAQRCIKIIRVEHGSISDLVYELTSLAKGMEFAKGTVVLIHSASHMARAGTVGYVEDFLREASLVKSVLGQHMLVAPAPPLFLAGCSCQETIRACAEICTWANKMYAGCDHFPAEALQRPQGCWHLTV